MTDERNPITARWEDGIEHDARSIEIFKGISEIDFKEGGDFFGFKSGGDGDNGEHLMYLLDEYFERKDGPVECHEIGEDFIEFSLLPDGTHSAAVEREAQRFLQMSGRTLVRVEGDNDTCRVQYIFTPELEFEEAEKLMEQFGVD
jgi:hypothetical protein